MIDLLFGYYGALWIKMRCNGTTIYFSVGATRDTMLDLPTTVAASAGFTSAADQAGFYVSPNNASMPAMVTLLSWSLA